MSNQFTQIQLIEFTTIPSIYYFVRVGSNQLEYIFKVTRPFRHVVTIQIQF